MKRTVYLGLGSNLGNRHANLIDAIHKLQAHVQIEEISSIYETKPWGYEDQPEFLNAVLRGITDLSPLELLSIVKKTEFECGRKPTFLYGPRVVDIDILFYEGEVVKTHSIVLPHPFLQERDFVLIPFAEIAPDLCHPVLNKTILELKAALKNTDIGVFSRAPMRIQDGQITKWWHWGRQTFVMGIINVTPDSFSGDGLFNEGDWIEDLVNQGIYMMESGADVLDVGGESTKPGAKAISAEEELRRVLPAIEALRKENLGPISVDTCKSLVVKEALKAGASMVNDVTGLEDNALASLLAESGAPIVIMHNKSDSKCVVTSSRLGNCYTALSYGDLIADIRSDLHQRVVKAQAAGIKNRQIIVDPGIGFGKTVSQNLELLNRLNEIKFPNHGAKKWDDAEFCDAVLDFPILIGPSRKSFIGYTLGLAPDERMDGTAAAVAVGITRGADIVRVHDVAPMVKVAKMTDAIVRRS